MSINSHPRSRKPGQFRTTRHFRVVAAFLLASATLLLLPIGTAIPQDMDADNGADFPNSRRARVAAMMGSNPLGVSSGGYRVRLVFEDDLNPAQMVLWVDQVLWQRTSTGDLFVARYRSDGTLINVVGPIRE